ncbi:type VI secretion system baseplate subunit TssG [Alphaproteobacteria bacterium KMM 3653]|uniref:Type VI secretion system baseplate subunit TssG n=1 Tax=Harenicola maris TaxID=2841044 RepID=A0AAP2CPJ4_9RHOB|nr:type VI secretion system baseplate subunit TssG [Harenicola maris]
MSAAVKTHRQLLEENPYRFDFLNLMRELERSNIDKPRIGKSSVLAQEIVTLGQDPFMAFPASNITAVNVDPDKPLEVRTQFLGFFGPQGALPLLTTIEAYRWNQSNDDSFIKFADIFATRYLQLFYRAWADARPIAQFDRPKEDRFADYVGSFVGIGSPAYKDRDRIPDIAKLPFAGVMAGRIKSAARLEQVLQGVLDVSVKVREREGIWLEFEDSDLTRIGRKGALGQDTYAGRRVYSINDKAVIEIRTESLEEYRSFLPGGGMFTRLADMVEFYLGDMVDFDVELALPRAHVPSTQLGKSGKLGWTSWSAVKKDDPNSANDDYVSDAVFSLKQADSGDIQHTT